MSKSEPREVEKAIERLYEIGNHREGYPSKSRELADDLGAFAMRVQEVLRDVDMAMQESAQFVGQVAEISGPDAEEINAPWNAGGLCYEAHTKVRELRRDFEGGG